MWQELALVHRESSDRDSIAGSGNRWRTCLREIVFLEPGETAPRNAKKGFEAHRFLVEVCAGLHSPLVGETEVFGQFRAFREEHEWHHAWESLLEAVELDVRKLRRTHLTNLGSQSYGSLARRRLPSGPVLILGAGLLTKDLLPWLAGYDITVAARNVKKASAELPAGTRVVALEDLKNPPVHHWIIAAPVANEFLETLWAKTEAGVVLDFRGEQKFAEAPARVSGYFDLKALFGELSAAKIRLEAKRREALTYAAELSARHADAVLHRPYGWEDAFA